MKESKIASLMGKGFQLVCMGRMSLLYQGLKWDQTSNSFERPSALTFIPLEASPFEIINEPLFRVRNQSSLRPSAKSDWLSLIRGCM